jgi:hypothetical protein
MYAVLTDFCIYLKLLNKIINRYDVARIFFTRVGQILNPGDENWLPGCWFAGMICKEKYLYDRVPERLSRTWDRRNIPRVRLFPRRAIAFAESGFVIF